MRHDIKALCVTTWGAVLEFKGWYQNENEPITPYARHRFYRPVALVADPDAIDCGQFISAHEIKLIIRRKT